MDTVAQTLKMHGVVTSTERRTMFQAFCYVCKEHIKVSDESEFRKAGHTNDRAYALKRYGVRANRLQSDHKLAKRKRV